MTRVKVAIVQQPAAVLDLSESLRRAAMHVTEAHRRGAALIVFPETWLTCYPAWVFGMAGWSDPEAESWHARLLAESPVLGEADDMSDGLAPLRDIACKLAVTIVIGTNERTQRGGTLYNALVTIGSDGHLLNVHRKLMPTHTERIVWGIGDAAGLRAVDTSAGRVGGLICWEHWMPLARHTLHASGEQIHVASWPDTAEMHLIASRQYAFEGGCFVLAAGLFLALDDIPADLQGAFRAGLSDAEAELGLVFDGGSAIIGPDGRWIVEPQRGSPGIIIAEIDLEEVDRSHQKLDVVGHYSRNDLFDLRVNVRRPDSVMRVDGPNPTSPPEMLP